MEHDPHHTESQEKLIVLRFVYGLDVDVGRVKNTIQKLQWYKEKGYRPALPDGLSENSSEEEMREAVFDEYGEKLYKAISDELTNMWGDTALVFEELKTIPDLRFHDEYEVFLTKYGVRGSYNADKGRVVLNIRSRDGERIAHTLKHEIVHMSIEYLIQKYGVSHWKKERLVDLMCEKYFGRIPKNIKEDVSDVDEAFVQSWPNVEEITRRIGEKTCS